MSRQIQMQKNSQMIECYETILCFPNFPLYKKKKKYEKFRGPFEHDTPGARPVRLPLNSPLRLVLLFLWKVFLHLSEIFFK